MKRFRINHIIFGLLTLLCGTAAQAQQRGVPSETLSAAWQPVKVDHYIGIRGGYAMGNARFEPTRQTEYKMGLILGGLVYKFDVPAQKYVGCIEADINGNPKSPGKKKYSIPSSSRFFKTYKSFCKALACI